MSCAALRQDNCSHKRISPSLSYKSEVCRDDPLNAYAVLREMSFSQTDFFLQRSPDF